MFLYRLALHLGEWNVIDPGGLADSMSVDQLYGWMAAYQMMPWGDEWLRDAVRMAQNYNAHRPNGKPALKPWDFMPVEQRPQSADEMWRILQSVGR